MKFRIFKKDKKKTKNDEDEEKYASFRNRCPLCKSGNFKQLFDDYAECIDCGHIYHQNLETIGKENTIYEYCPRCGGNEFKFFSDEKIECSSCRYVFQKKKGVKKELKEVLYKNAEKKEVIFKEEVFDLGSVKNDVQSLKEEKEIKSIECPKCGSTETEEYIREKYRCKDCGYRFLKEMAKEF